MIFEKSMKKLWNVEIIKNVIFDWATKKEKEKAVEIAKKIWKIKNGI